MRIGSLRRVVIQALIVSCFTTMGAAARADDPPKDADKPKPPPTEKDYWTANAQAGLLWLWGNSNSLALSGSFKLQRKDLKNIITLSAKGAYALSKQAPAAGSPDLGYQNSAENGQVELRYDRIFSEKNTVFVAGRFSGDKFAGILGRPELQVGYSRFFLDRPKQVFRGEFGLDYMYEIYNNRYAPNPNAAHMDAMGNMVPAVLNADFTLKAPDPGQFLSARVLLGYENKFTQYASFSETVEVVMAFLNFNNIGAGADTFKHTLLTSTTTLSSTISKNVSLKLNFTLKGNFAVDNDKIKYLDTITEAVIAVTFL